MSAPPSPSQAPSAPPQAARPPWRAIAGLTAAVALLHAVALHWLPAGLPGGTPSAAPLPFAVRMVDAPAPPPAPPVAAARPPAAPSPTRASRPRSTPAPAPAADSATESIAEATTTDSAPAAASSAEPAAPADTAEAPPPPSPPTVAPPPLGLPASTRLLYDAEGHAKGLTYRAKSELTWRQDGARYEARLELSAFLIGSRVQTSEGRIDATGLVPERFADKARREQATHFDPAAGRIVFSSNAPEARWLPGTQDRLGVFLQLGALLAGDPARYPAGATIAVPTGGTREAEEWRFVVGEPEMLTLPAGELPALRLERAPRKEYDTRVEVWYAPGRAWLPVRLKITQASGDYVDQKLSAIENP